VYGSVTQLSGFSTEAPDVPTKTANLTKDQGRYFNLQAEKTTNLNSILTNDMDRQSFHICRPCTYV
jgi:hypothetical protein